MDSELSREMIMEIMSRSSLRTLDTMRCVSKELNTLTYESCFFDLYKKRNKIVSGYLIQHPRTGYAQEFAPSPESSSLDLRTILPENARILATSEHGIILFQNLDNTNINSKYSYHVCKPTTNQFLALPDLERVYTRHKFAIVVISLKPLHYKVISFSDRTHMKGNICPRSYCDIFDSLTWEWRSLSHVKLPYGVSFTNSVPITQGGSIYMLLTYKYILKLDVHSEKCKAFLSPIPHDDSNASRSSVELVKYGGRLGLAHKPRDPNVRWDIWVLTMDELWEKMCVCKRKEDSLESLKAFCDLDTSVMLDRETLLFYRFKQEGNNMISKVALKGIPYQIFSFRSDFEPIDLI